MAKRNVCTACKMFVEGGMCPNCKGNQFANSWQGRIYINDPEKSLIAQKLGIKMAGEYAIKLK